MNYKLSKYVIKRYEPNLDTYFFYNAKKELYWQCDYSTGEIISCMDGSLSLEEIIDIVSRNNPQLDSSKISKKLSETFEFLINEEYICESR